MWVGNSHQQRAMCDVRDFGLVVLLGLRIMCQQSMLEAVSSGDEDDNTFP